MSARHLAGSIARHSVARSQRTLRTFAASLFCLVLSALLLAGCASVKTEGVQGSVGSALGAIPSDAPYPAFAGTPLRVQVLKFSIPAEVAKGYPELGDKQVGWGLANRIVDEFFETGRFKFVEEKMEMQQKLIAQWALSESGIVAEDQKIASEGLSAPQQLVYAELTDFSVSQSEQVVGVSLEKRATTRVGVQLRVLDVGTGEYVPASGLGEATTVGTAVWVNPQMSFDQTTVGLATRRAVREAVHALLKRMEARQAWGAASK
jgi:curli biogenesis system outer membrane secretion channel CsgG